MVSGSVDCVVVYLLNHCEGKLVLTCPREARPTMAML